MKFALLICIDEPEKFSTDEEAQLESAAAAWGDQMRARGVLLPGLGFHPRAEARTVRVADDRVLVTDGPFAATKEEIAGYGLIECVDIDAAIGIASQHPVARKGAIEVRPGLDPS